MDANDAPVAADVWGDEYQVVREAMDWAEARVVRETDPKTTARSAEDLREAAGQTVCPAGIGGLAALRVFMDVLEPATRAQDDPMNLAYVPSAPTRASVAFDFVTSAANVFGGMWETGAGAIFAENEALAWLVELLGWPRTAGGCFASGGTSGNVGAGRRTRSSPGSAGEPSCPGLAARVHRRGALLGSLDGAGAGRHDRRGPRRREWPADRRSARAHPAYASECFRCGRYRGDDQRWADRRPGRNR